MSKSIHESEAAYLLAKLIAETDPRRRRELTLKLDVARALADKARAEQADKEPANG